MSDDDPFAILSEDGKAITKDWDILLKKVQCPVTIATSTDSTDVSLQCVSPVFFDLKFGSAYNEKRFGLQAAAGPDKEEGTILLGLENAASTPDVDRPLSDLISTFTTVSSIDDGQGLISKILTPLENAKISLKLRRNEQRNALWCIPGQTDTVRVALVYEFSDAAVLQDAVKEIAAELGIQLNEIPPFVFYFQRDFVAVKTRDSSGNRDYYLSSSFGLTIRTTMKNLDFWIRLENQGCSVSVSQVKGSESLWKSLGNFIGTGMPPAADSKPSGIMVADSVPIELLSISAGKFYKGSLWWNIQSVLSVDLSSQVNLAPIRVMLSYDSRFKSFTGTLLTRSSFSLGQESPGFVPGLDFEPQSFDITTMPQVLKLSDIFSEGDTLPNAFPDEIAAAQVSFSSVGQSSILAVQLALTRSETNSVDNVPVPFTWDDLRLTASTSKTKPPNGPSASSFACSVSTTFTLHPNELDIDKYAPAQMQVQLSYISGSWVVSASIKNLQFGILGGFFEKELSRDVVQIMGKLSVNQMNVLYTYSQKLASSFLLTGVITLGKLQMNLFFQYVSDSVPDGQSAAQLNKSTLDSKVQILPKPKKKGAVWDIDCVLGAADSEKTTLGDIIDSIVEEGSENMPDFIKEIEINPASGSEPAIRLRVRKIMVDGPDQIKSPAIIFALTINILGVEFCFVQMSSGGVSRRVIRLAVDKIPLVSSIPLLKNLSQPFEELVYLWVLGTTDLTKADVNAINTTLESTYQLMYKESTRPSDPAKNDAAIAIFRGHHFIVVENKKVVLDYRFGVGGNQTSTEPKAITAPPNPSPAGSGIAQPASPPEPTKGALSKTMGLLDISAVTLQFKGQILWIHLDAILTLGPLSLGLLGFGIGLDTKGIKLNNLKDVWTEMGTDGLSRFHWELHGMSLAFDRPPLTIAAMFYHDIVPISGGKMEIYKGGVGVGFPPYTFMGVGSYAIVEQAGQKYKSVFVFAKLDGPLVTLEFATISGVRLGFGYNSMMRSPSINELTSFPLLKSSQAAGAGNNPMVIMQSMDTWVMPKLDSFWFAAGMTITAFDLIAITAVAMFAFRDAGVIISIFANAVAKLPPGPTPQEAVILYVEIGLVAEMNLIDGYFRVEASLSPVSYLLVPQCRLTGGFALVYWFGNSPQAGQWVFSIGGYHRAFQAPAYYPKPKRIGIAFEIGDHIQMIGQSYFAITPKCAMAGAMIHISLDVGIVSAYLDATFDALINFHPFYYVVEFAVSVGVECDIDVWFIHIHISAHIGANLHIEGPPFHGVAHVDFWVVGFDVHFGPDASQPDPQSLIEFWSTTHSPGPASAGRVDDDQNPLQAALVYRQDNRPSQSPAPSSGAAFKFILQAGNLPQPMPSSNTSTTPSPAGVPSTGAGASWKVKGGDFSFGVTTEFVLSRGVVIGTSVKGEEGDDLPLATDQTEPVYAKPMRNNVPLESTLTITVYQLIGRQREIKGGWRDVRFIRKNVPIAMWTAYDPRLDPLHRETRNKPPESLLNGENATVDKAVGISLLTPEPVLSISLIPKFKATAAQRMKVPDTRVSPFIDWRLPSFEPEQNKFLSANLTEAESKLDLPHRWTTMKNTWLGLNDKQSLLNNPTDGILTQAAKDIFEWDKRPSTSSLTPVSVASATGAVTSGSKTSVIASSVDPRLLKFASLATNGTNSNPWQLVGTLPTKLIGKLEDTYLALPRKALAA